MDEQQLVHKLRNIRLKQVKRLQQDKIKDFQRNLLMSLLSEEAVDKDAWLKHLEDLVNMHKPYEQDKSKLDDLDIDKLKGPKKPDSMVSIEDQVESLSKEKEIQSKSLLSGILKKLGLKKE